MRLVVMNDKANPSKVLIACVGGFLGAGKTTALAAAARELVRRGLRVGVITNDQGSALVDTEIMRNLNLPTAEITGGCFCCKFNELVDRANKLLLQVQPHVILAEAVGSCTDLAATVYQPLRKFYADSFDLAPLSVFVEPARLDRFVNGDWDFPESVAYLFRQQLTEADIIVLSKRDTITPDQCDELQLMLRDVAGKIPLHVMSAIADQGVVEWVDMLLCARTGAGTSVLDIDYEVYAQAEASLGWLNATAEITSPKLFSPRTLAEKLANKIQVLCSSAHGTIAHLKILIVTADGCGSIAVTNNQDAPAWNADDELNPTAEVSLIINARVQTNPDVLAEFIKDSVAKTARAMGAVAHVQHMESFSPLPPRPAYRLPAPV